MTLCRGSPRSDRIGHVGYECAQQYFGLNRLARGKPPKTERSVPSSKQLQGVDENGERNAE